MIRTDAWLPGSGLDIRMIMQVHDELVFEIRDSHMKKSRVEIDRLMVGVAALKVPLVVDIGTGSNWDEAH